MSIDIAVTEAECSFGTELPENGNRGTLVLTTMVLCVVQGYQHELLVPQTISYYSATSVGGVLPHGHAVLVQSQSARNTQATMQRPRGIHGETTRACLQVHMVESY